MAIGGAISNLVSGAGTVPTSPSYTSPPPVTPATAPATPGFTSAPAFNTLGANTSGSNVPQAQSAPQVMGSAAQADSSLPKFLQIGTNPTSPQAQQQFENAYWNQYQNPQI